MICKFCGNVIEDNSDFCFICGQKVVAETPAYAAEVYSQKPEGAPAQAAPVAPEQPVYAAPAQPVYAEQPVYAPPVVPVEETGKKGKKKAKKAAKAASGELSKGGRFFTGLFAALFFAVAGILVLMGKPLFAIIAAVVGAIVGLSNYKKYTNAVSAGYEEKAVDIANTAMIGVCVGLAVIVFGLIKAYVLG